ncbi:hypothetical protein WN48_06243 [Eufriesea mexicana]|uniref:Uncharacterized protein n=1 Tax=Eufriesea mexicana TaxID=516756 RepID=A0A310S900_9HYME|nr:hypothetical protein WN48_06243 [Eufriesea mexicana]
MHKNNPNMLPELLASYYRCMWPDLVLMTHNSSPIGQKWPFLGDCFLQTVQLLTVQVRIENFAIGEQLIDNSLPILPNTQQNLTDRQSCLGHRLRRLTGDSTTAVFA